MVFLQILFACHIFALYIRTLTESGCSFKVN